MMEFVSAGTAAAAQVDRRDGAVGRTEEGSQLSLAAQARGACFGRLTLPKTTA